MDTNMSKTSVEDSSSSGWHMLQFMLVMVPFMLFMLFTEERISRLRVLDQRKHKPSAKLKQDLKEKCNDSCNEKLPKQLPKQYI